MKHCNAVFPAPTIAETKYYFFVMFQVYLISFSSVT